MKGFFRHIACLLFAAVCVAGCVSDRPFGEQGGPGKGDQYYLSLRIRPVDDTRADGAVAVREKIRTLRVVVLNEQAIEYNRFINLEKPESFAADGFEYHLFLPTSAGRKKVYLFANEGSVQRISYQLEQGQDGLPNQLSDLLESYCPEGPDQLPNTAPDPDPAAFERLVNAVHFAPDYTPDQDGALYLPYTACYTGIEAGKGEVKDVTLYLVPAATKFRFDFSNYRDTPVQIREITVNGFHDRNFLLAQVGETDYRKTLDGEELYWVDWLAKISALSQSNGSYSDNLNFNARYGWISDYRLPETAVLAESKFVVPEDGRSIAGAETEDTPVTLSLGPFYRPESLRSEENNGQIYRLTLRLHDAAQEDDSEDPQFENVAIQNLQALFRNTFVVIHVKMSRGDVEVYAEIQDWNHRSINGYVVEE